MKPRLHILSVALLGATFLVGCVTKTSAPSAGSVPGAGGEGSSSSLGSWEPKERFSLDLGIKDDGKPTGLTGLAVSADGKLALGMATAQAGNVQVWDLQNRKKLYQYDSQTGSMLPVAISPDGKLGAYFDQLSGSVVLIDLGSGKEVRRLRKKGGEPLSSFTPGLVFSPKGDLVAVASRDEVIGLNPATGDQQFDWKETAEVSALSGFFDDGKKMAVGTEKGSVKVWDVATGKAAQTLVEGGKDKINKLFLSGDGKRLGAATAIWGPIQIFDLPAGKVVNEVKGASPGIWSSIQFLPDKRTVVYNGDWDLVLQDTVTGEKKSFSPNKEIRRLPVAVTPDGSTLLSSAEDGKLVVWDLKSGR